MMRSKMNIAILSLLAVTGLALAQDQPQAPDQTAGQQPYAGQYPSSNAQGYPAPTPFPPQQGSMQQDNRGGYAPGGYAPGGYAPTNYAPPAPPAHLTVKPGTYVTVRVNQWLSSDRNQPGDAFAATLEQPLVVDGFVVAQRGQTVGGRVSDAQKAGRVAGTSRLGLQITDITLVDGQVVPVQAAMVTRNGSTSVGRDAAAMAGTTGLGAAAGAVADAGRGAAIGAGAGAVVGLAGVLLTRGNPTVIYPESVLTFRLDAPVEVATDHAPQAFRYADQMDYGRAPYPSGPASMSNCYNCAPAPVAVRPYPYVAPYPYYPYYPVYGFGFGFYARPGYVVLGGRGFRR